jgi:SAM-dependent methyltransferase
MADSDFLSTTRTFYDAVAEDYATLFQDELANRPLERALLSVFAELVEESGAGGDGLVADLGCGPGRTTGRLAALGLNVFGLDLSESMLAIARRENPELRFEQGSMLELDLPDGSLPVPCPSTPPSTPRWTGSRPSSPSSTVCWRRARPCSSPSRPATSTGITTSPGATRSRSPSSVAGRRTWPTC